MSNYLSIEYDANKRPFTDYPGQLCAHLFQRFGMRSGMKFLEPGCGRCEFLQHFKRLGLDAYGVDICPEASSFQTAIPVSIANIEKEGIPFPDSTFDVVYSKSLLEHFFDPETYFREAYRVLKPGGLLLTLVPDWESNYKIYFDDYTHRTPFTAVSLDSIYRLFRFNSVAVEKFRQLPIVWEYPALNYICTAISPFVPVRTKTKFLRWSRELMLVGVGTKVA
jgi:SAM-dependent methyltransferase